MTPNERAYELLRWQTVLEPAPYDELVDYFSIWKKRSDKALDLFDKQHNAASKPKDNRRVEGAKAETRNATDPASSSRREADSEREGTRLDGRHARHGNRIRNRRRYKRQ